MSDDESRATAKLLRQWSQLCPPRFRDYRLETSPQVAAAEIVMAWLDSAAPDTGGVLLIYGPTGTGKTGLAIGAMFDVFSADPENWPPVFANAPRWLDDQRPGRTTVDPMVEARTTPFLVLDDIGAEQRSEWAWERYYLLLNDRYEERLPTVVTTNLGDVGAISSAIGERVMSRLGEQITLLPLVGGDLRRQG